MSVFDIDIDVPPGTDIAKLFPGSVPAALIQNGQLKQHPCGTYFENIPVDPVTNVAAIPYKQATEVGYMKVDFLHLYILSGFKSKAEFLDAAQREPDWSLLLDRSVLEQLFQIKKHYDVVFKVKPKSLEELADVIALIRPDKRAYLDQYLRDRTKTRPHLYRETGDDKSAFRRGHSLAYAMTIIAQLNTISNQSA